MFFSIIALIVSSGVIVYNIYTTGSFMERSTELKGGKSIVVTVGDVNVKNIEDEFPFASVQLVTGATKTLVVEIPFEKNETEVIAKLHTLVKIDGEPSVSTVGPVLGEMFFQQAQLALVTAFIFMAIVVFILFRSFVPSTAVVLSAATDIVTTIAISSILGIRLSLPVLAALLTLIGYSVDTDILLTSELLKSGDSDRKRCIRRAMKTGISLVSTTLAALFAIYFISGAFVLQQIALVLIIGLIIDIFATWFTNAGILRWWLDRKNKVL